MSQWDDLPDRRTSLKGRTAEGDEAWLIRDIARKLYRCPGCHGDISIGDEHVVVQYVRRVGGTDHHHWHQPCVADLLVPELRSLNRVSAKETGRDRLEARGRRSPRRRR